MIKSIRLKTGIAAPDWSFAPGDVVKIGDKIDEAEAVRLINADVAELESGEIPKTERKNTQNDHKSKENEQKNTKNGQKTVKTAQKSK